MSRIDDWRFEMELAPGNRYKVFSEAGTKRVRMSRYFRTFRIENESTVGESSSFTVAARRQHKMIAINNSSTQRRATRAQCPNPFYTYFAQPETQKPRSSGAPNPAISQIMLHLHLKK